MEASPSDQNESLRCGICNHTGPINRNHPVQCRECGRAVHIRHCYETTNEIWTSGERCDECRYPSVQIRRKCLLCDTGSTDIMCYIQNVNKHIEKFQNESETGTWCHALCFHWLEYTRNIGFDDTLFSSADQECAYCSSSSGHVIKCFGKDCEQYVHALCAQNNEALIARPWKYNSDILLHYAGCKRHKKQRYTTESLCRLLGSSQVQRCLEADTVKYLTTIEEEMLAVHDTEALLVLLRSITSRVESDCTSLKSEDDNRYDIRRLQLLYLVLCKVEEIGKAYGIHRKSLGVSNFLNSADLADTLVCLFDPATNRPDHTGPFNLIDPCRVCKKPFYQRHHVFYCLNEKEPHSQHWKCTLSKTDDPSPTLRKGKSIKSSAERAVKSGGTLIMEVGTNKLSQFPGPIPHSLKQSHTCGICGSLIDPRSLLMSSEDENFVQRYQAQSSRYQSSGRNVNCSPDSKKENRKRIEQMVEDGEDTLIAYSKRTRTKEIGGGTSEEHRLQPPQKLERVNIQRTTKWIGNVIAIIQLSVIKSEVKMIESEQATTSKYAIRSEALDASIESCYQQALEIAKTCDTYAFTQLQKAHEMLVTGCGLAIAMLHTLLKEYTCAIYAKHTKAVEKVNHEKKVKTPSDRAKKRTRK